MSTIEDERFEFIKSRLMKTYNAANAIVKEKKTVDERMNALFDLYENASTLERFGVVYGLMMYISYLEPVEYDEEPNEQEPKT